MSVKSLGKDFLFVVFLVLVGVASRMIPHPWNFTAIGSMALFSGFSFRTNKFLVLVPFVSLMISDMLIGFYNVMVYTYIGFAVGIVLSLVYFAQQSPLSFKGRALTLAGLSVVSSFVFFLVTNFGVWMGSTFYSQDMTGLITAYIAGLPFLFNQIAGDLVYGAAIFGLYEYVKIPVKFQKTVA